MTGLVQETPDDWWEVEALYDLVFAPGREALSSYRLRDGVPPIPELCLLSRDVDGNLGGAIRCWPVRIGPAKAILLGPVAVHPTRQGEGLGAYLIGRVLDVARDMGWRRVMLVGDAPYYSRFGFTKLKDVKMPPPTNPDRVLGIDLFPEAWKGIKGHVRKAKD
jgi:predicted N-acetyltransferase YhbS